MKYEIAGGTITGRDHVFSGKNNHDAYAWRCFDSGVIAVVCDGCGSGAHSEVGANIGAQLFIQAAKRQLDVISIGQKLDKDRFMMDLLSPLQVMTRWLGDSMSKVVSDYFLFTMIGAIVTTEQLITFVLGDGVLMIDDSQSNYDYKNKPPYLGYHLVSSAVDKSDLNPIINHISIGNIDLGIWSGSLLLGTDGVNDLIRVQNDNIPGKDRVIGPISQFWEDDKYFKNKYAITRKLRLINKESNKIDWEQRKVNTQKALLPDDTTLIVIRLSHERTD